MPVTLINPRAEVARERQGAAARLASLEGRTVGLLDISKPGGSFFLDHLEHLLTDGRGVGRVVRETKPTFTKPAPDDVIERLISAKCDVVIEALAD